MYKRFLLAFVSLLAAVTGCAAGWEADYSKLGLVEVGGKVTLDGVPVGNATVVFEAEDGTYSSGSTDASGNYKLQFDSEKSGVLPGGKVVRIRTGSGEGEDAPAEGEQPASKGAKKSADTIPACYNTKSELRTEVKSPATINFSLKSDCSTKSAD